jgi:hypothetical protein
MSKRKALPATEVKKGEDDASFVDILDLATTRAPETTPEPDPEPVTKGLKDSVVAETKAVLTAVTEAVNELGSAEEVPEAVSQKFGAASAKMLALAKKVGADAGNEPEEQEQQKSAADVVKMAKGIVGKLTALVAKAEALEGDEIPEEMTRSIGEIAESLSHLAAQGSEADTKKAPPVKKEEEVEVFKRVGEDGEPELLIKRGAAMKKVRLSQLRGAVKVLNELLADLDPSGEEAKGGGKVKKEAPAPAPAVDLEPLTKGLEAITGKLDSALERLATVEKAASVAPVSAADDDDADKKPVNKAAEPGAPGFWGGVVS